MQVLVPSVAVTTLLYQISWVRIPAAYVAAIAPGMSVKVTPSGLSCHWNVKVPSPVGAVAVNAAGVPPSQMDCAAEMVPGVKLITVTLQMPSALYRRSR